MRSAITVLSLLSIAVLASGFGFSGTSPQKIDAFYDADSSRYLGQRYVLWGSRNATGVAEFLRFGQACTFDTSSTSAEGWPVLFDAAITEVMFTCGNVTAQAPNCTLKVWSGGFGKSPTLEWAQKATLGGTEHDGEGMTKSWSLASVDVDKGDLLFIELVAETAAPVNANYPNVFVTLRERE